MFYPKELLATSEEKLPAGTYYIGDIGYLVRDEDEWHELLRLADHFNAPRMFRHEKYGYLWAAHTAYGDGIYESNFGDVFTVDGGLIGIVDHKFMLPERWKEYWGVAKVSFSRAFRVSRDEDGTFRFGAKRIWTGFDG